MKNTLLDLMSFFICWTEEEIKNIPIVNVPIRTLEKLRQKGLSGEEVRKLALNYEIYPGFLFLKKYFNWLHEIIVFNRKLHLCYPLNIFLKKHKQTN